MQHLTPPSQNPVPYSRPASPRPQLQIGFVGLGNMGYLMARNLANHNAQTGSPPLLVWNRSSEKASNLVSEVGPGKARAAKDLEEVVQLCDIIVTSLANDQVVKSVYQQYAKILTDHPPAKSKIFVETSTIYPKVAGELDKLLFNCTHVHFISCQVVGPPISADKARLVLIMSGDYRFKKEVAYLLVPAIGFKVIDLGSDVEKAPTLKLIANSMILGNLEVLSEAYTMASKTDIESSRVFELIQDILPAPLIVNYANRMANGLFDGSTGFGIDGGVKDASHIRRLTEEHNSPMPVVDVAHQHLLGGRALHRRDKARGKAAFEVLDWSGLLAGTRAAAGLNGFETEDVTSGNQ